MNNKKNVDIWYKEIVWIYFMYLKIGCYIKIYKIYNFWNSYIVYFFLSLKIDNLVFYKDLDLKS